MGIYMGIRPYGHMVYGPAHTGIWHIFVRIVYYSILCINVLKGGFRRIWAYGQFPCGMYGK